jgi:hypothetical protein
VVVDCLLRVPKQDEDHVKICNSLTILLCIITFSNCGRSPKLIVGLGGRLIGGPRPGGPGGPAVVVLRGGGPRPGRGGPGGPGGGVKLPGGPGGPVPGGGTTAVLGGPAGGPGGGRFKTGGPRGGPPPNGPGGPGGGGPAPT